jgi:DNA excision repair protein ERCC-4
MVSAAQYNSIKTSAIIPSLILPHIVYMSTPCYLSPTDNTTSPLCFCNLPVPLPVSVNKTIEESVEEHRYVGSLSREKKAFEKLIDTKQHMVISLPDHQDDLQRERQADRELTLDTRSRARGNDDMGIGFGGRGELGAYPLPPPLSSTVYGDNSRGGRGGGENNKRGSFKVVIDVREFRSSLPSLLHASGFELVPRTLQVGDYVLTPEICIGL